MTSKIFLHYLVGVIDERLELSFRFNVIIPWLKWEIEQNGPALRELDWTREYAENELRRFETIALTRLAESLWRGKIKLLDAILVAWPILLRETQAGLIDWHTLGFYNPDWRTLGFYSPRNIFRLAQVSLMRIISLPVNRLINRLIHQRQTTVPPHLTNVLPVLPLLPGKIVNLADFSRGRSPEQPAHLGKTKP